MGTNVSKLKGLKGTPPKLLGQRDVISMDTRPANQELKPLQVRIPRHIFEEFSECAGREFGFSHGGKKKLFLKMWDSYKAQNM